MSYRSLQDAAENGWEVERQYLCHAHRDSRASASLNMNGYYICYACGDRGRLDMSEIHVTPTGVKRLIESIEEKLYPVRYVYSEGWLDIFDADGPGDYWLSRYSRETCEFYRLGRTSERSTYPMRSTDGEVLGVVYRNPDQEPKYTYPWGVKVSEQLFDIHRLRSRDLVLTEGPTDAMACYEAGKHVGTSSYRNGISKTQADLIRKYNPRVLWVAYDMDGAGDRGFESVQKVFEDVKVRRLEWSGGKDLSELGLDHRAEVLGPVLI